MEKSIPELEVGNEIYQIKDRTAREHLIEIDQTQPTSEDNKLWIKNQEEEYEIPTMDEFNSFKNNVNSGLLGEKRLVFNQDGTVTWTSNE